MEGPIIFFDVNQGSIVPLALKILEQLSVGDILKLRCVDRETNRAVLTLLTKKKAAELRYCLPLLRHCVMETGKLPIENVYPTSLTSSFEVQPLPSTLFQQAINTIVCPCESKNFQEIRNIKTSVIRALYHGFSDYNLPEITFVDRSRLHWMDAVKITAQWKDVYPEHASIVLSRIGMTQESGSLLDTVRSTNRHASLNEADTEEASAELAIAHAKNGDLKGTQTSAACITNNLHKIRAQLAMAVSHYDKGEIEQAKSMISDVKRIFSQGASSSQGTKEQLDTIERGIFDAELTVGTISIEAATDRIANSNQVNNELKALLNFLIKREDWTSLEKIVARMKDKEVKSEVWRTIGEAQQKCGHHERAKKSAKRAYQALWLVSSKVIKRRELLMIIRLLLQLGKFKKAKCFADNLNDQLKQWVVKLIDISQGNEEGMSKVVELFDQYYKESWCREKLAAESQKCLAFEAARSGNIDEAKNFVANNISSLHERVHILMQMGIKCVKNNRLEDAKKFLALTKAAAKESISADRNVNVWAYVARLKIYLGDVEGAKKTFNKKITDSGKRNLIAVTQVFLPLLKEDITQTEKAQTFVWSVTSSETSNLSSCEKRMMNACLNMSIFCAYAENGDFSKTIKVVEFIEDLKGEEKEAVYKNVLKFVPEWFKFADLEIQRSLSLSRRW